MSASAAAAVLLTVPAVLAAATPSMSLNPNTTNIAQGGMVLVTVRENSVDLPVNAVQANVSYPSDKLELKNINYTGSTFTVAAEESKSDGLVKMARGRTGTPLTGDQMVATLTFVSKKSGAASLGFASGSVVVNATTAQSINASLMGATVTIAAPVATPTPTPTPSKTPTPTPSPSASPSASPKPTSSPKPSTSPTPSAMPVGSGSGNDTPTTLPETGAAAGILGVGIIGGSTYLYMRSKRNLLGTLRQS
jgi:hypothetical protein